jgi:hypothetical protein
MGMNLAPAIVLNRVMTLNWTGAATMRRREERTGDQDVG